MTAPPKLSRQQLKVRNALRAKTTPIAPKRYIISERQLAEAFTEWIRRDDVLRLTPPTGATCARYLLELIGELASEYARKQ